MTSNNCICARGALRTSTRVAAWRRVIGYGLAHAQSRHLLAPFRTELDADRPISVHADIKLLGRWFSLGITRAVSGEIHFQLLDTNRRRDGIVALAAVDLIVRRGTVIARVPEKLLAFSGWSRVDVEAIGTLYPELSEIGFEWSDLRARRAMPALTINGTLIGGVPIANWAAQEGHHARR
ncbi:hypothetical protein AB4Y36_19450 [Paraburkholderia sp. BR10936]|uniref:hypothetical protein n=1 Tax=Paraburkholderia sp. BR10936 TaxID=3236993 RepID=UPI0034D1F7CF